jgi:GT2 family glycosyltransferase
MITIIYSTHKDEKYNEIFKQHLLKNVGISNVQIIEFVNHNQYSLSELYNKGIMESTFDIVCCIHNDIKLEKNWGKRLLEDFSKNPEFAIIGKAGSCYFPKSGVYWEKMKETMVGQVYHHPPGQKKWISKYSVKLPFLIPVVTIDGLFISFDKTKIKHKFDETIGKFHFYDHLFCLPNYLDGVKIGVTSSFEITHQSVGKPNDEFYDSKEKFLSKWSTHLPLDLKPEFVFTPIIDEKPIKKIGKVAVIIPTKGKVKMLFDCVDSLYKHCNPNLFDVFIADTGSSEDEKKWIKDEILGLGNIKLIEYDYYNFAKINNDIVTNHIGNEYEYLLFCNNDIKVLNNVIYGMLKTFKENHRCGTVGARLHFSDNTIQHDGVFMGVNDSGVMGVSHYNLYNYYNYNIGTKENFGNTAALLMIRKNVFIISGMFNENYISCFEDVELNMQVLIRGYKNLTCGNCVAYHYESQTRNEDNEKMRKLRMDYTKNLLPVFLKNIDKLKDKLVTLQ